MIPLMVNWKILPIGLEDVYSNMIDHGFLCLEYSSPYCWPGCECHLILTHQSSLPGSAGTETSLHVPLAP